jgi:two-component system, chemotaxis family, response regulator Rcp1
MPYPSAHPVQVLLVEDSPDDADLMVEALREGSLDLCISRVEDGESAVAFLRRQAGFEAAPRPDLILLDLYLPRKNGLEVLADLKGDPDLRLIPVVLLTSASDDRVFLAAYDLHANCCVVKPADQEQYARTVRHIEHFWLTVARRVRKA